MDKRFFYQSSSRDSLNNFSLLHSHSVIEDLHEHMDNNVHEHVKYEAENVLKNIQEESRDEDLDTVTINYQISQKSRKEREERLPWPFNAMK